MRALRVPRPGGESSARRPSRTMRRASAPAAGIWSSVTGRTATWTGAIHAGNAPAWTSVRWATRRSRLPRTLRWTMTGRCGLWSAAM